MALLGDIYMTMTIIKLFIIIIIININIGIQKINKMTRNF